MKVTKALPPVPEYTDTPLQVSHFVRDEPFQVSGIVSRLIPNEILDTGDDEQVYAYVATKIRHAMCLQCHDRGCIYRQWLNPNDALVHGGLRKIYCPCSAGTRLRESERDEKFIRAIDAEAEARCEERTQRMSR